LKAALRVVIVGQNNYLIAMLWNKAIPADAMFNDLEHGHIPERTEIVSGEENVMKFTKDHECKIKGALGNCNDAITAFPLQSYTHV
jgi:hypothetical protein